MAATELRPGLWHWQAPHPEWTSSSSWPERVSSYAIDDGERLLLFDPLAVPDELLELAARRELVVVLTSPWHERSARDLVDRLGVDVLAPPPDTAADLIEKFGITPEEAGNGSPDLRWLRDRGHEFGRLPNGIEAFEGREHNDLVLWVGASRAVIAGDTLVDFGDGLQIVDWLREDVTREEVAVRLRPLLAYPVELVLPTHGGPTDRAALDRALA